jgi:D-alanyl-D-alanine carboxypeptidase (penicillin-binding protein 5/6)
VVAEALAGSEQAFAGLMNKKARDLGMTSSHFKNSTGWPDAEHVMSPKDLAILSQRLIEDFPEFYHYLAETEFTWSDITQHNRNPLLGSDLGVDGLKTGHTEDAGYGITLSAQQDDRRLVAVLNGMDSMKTRAQMGRVVLLKGFTQFKPAALFAADKKVAELPVHVGAEDVVAIGPADAVKISLPRDDSAVKFVVESNAPLQAPVAAGAEAGVLKIMNGDSLLKTVPLVTLKEVPRAGFFKRLRMNLQTMTAS